SSRSPLAADAVGIIPAWAVVRCATDTWRRRIALFLSRSSLYPGCRFDSQTLDRPERLMSQATVAPRTLTARYEEEFPNSRKLFEQARAVFPNGVTHDL